MFAWQQNICMILLKKFDRIVALTFLFRLFEVFWFLQRLSGLNKCLLQLLCTICSFFVKTVDKVLQSNCFHGGFDTLFDLIVRFFQHKSDILRYRTCPLTAIMYADHGRKSIRFQRMIDIVKNIV